MDEKNLRAAKRARVVQRSIAALLYYSGKLHRIVDASILAGAPPWRILRYERITSPETHMYPLPLHQYVRPKTFEKHLQYLTRHCHVIPLSELIDRIKRKTPILPRTIAITFDGGFAEGYAHALPLLQRYNVPATFFLPTGLVDTTEILWQDKLLIATFFLQEEGLGLKSVPMMDTFFPEITKETGLDFHRDMTRIVLLINKLRTFGPMERALVIRSFAKALEHVEKFPIERSFLTWKEVQAMQSPNISFGMHGHRYLYLSEISKEELAADLRESVTKFRTEKITPLKIYAYPEGFFSKEGREALLELGIEDTLSIGGHRPSEQIGRLANLYGRVSLYESVSFCKEMFACRIFGTRETETSETHD